MNVQEPKSIQANCFRTGIFGQLHSFVSTTDHELQNIDTVPADAINHQNALNELPIRISNGLNGKQQGPEPEPQVLNIEQHHPSTYLSIVAAASESSEEGTWISCKRKRVERRVMFG